VGREVRVFFFLKKKEAKKTLPACARAGRLARAQADKVFLLLFLQKKKTLTCLEVHPGLAR
jgi:hypothetical protein